MHILGVVLVAVVLLTGIYFTGPKSNSSQVIQPSPPSGQVQALPINSPTPDNKETMITIRNKKTGETKQVPQSQVSNYAQATQQPKVIQASDKALKLSVYAFVASNEKQKNDLISKFSNGTNDLKEAVKNLALLLDSKPEALALIEKTIAQDIANKKSISDREAIGEYHQKEYERLKAEIDSIPKVTNNTYTGGTRNTATTPTKSGSTQVNTFQDNTQEINNRLKSIVNTPDVNKFLEPNIIPYPTENPEINVYGNADSYTRYGNTVYGSDGSNYTQYGNTVYGNDGSNYTKYGNTVYGNDGSSFTKYGNTTYGNDGTSYTQYGNTTYGNDGSSYTQYGNTVYTQSGY